MKYYYIIEGSLRNNIGDVLQGMVAKQFINTSAIVADRENMKGIQSKSPGLLIANGWYMHSFENFPPNNNITPIYVSVHIAQSKLLLDEATRVHFKNNGPVGCRDSKTLKLLLGWGIPAYYSNCMTITADGVEGVGQMASKANDEIVIVDGIDHRIPDAIVSHLEKLYGQSIIRISHDPQNTKGTFLEYAASSEKHMVELLNRYKNAKLVITTKIHSALPCLGVGANVLLIHPNPSDPRLQTVSKYLKVNSFDEVMNWNTIPENKVNYKVLAKSQRFIRKLVSTAVLQEENPIKLGSNLSYSYIYLKSIIMAKIYRSAVKLILVFNIKVETVQRVYK
jgi:hypothetical protein